MLNHSFLFHSSLSLGCLQEAQRLGDEFLSLEKYVNLNYLVRGYYILTSF